MRSIHIQKDKTVFKLDEYPAEAYAASMGLPGAPQIKLLEKNNKNKERGAQKAEDGPVVIHQRLGAMSDEESDEDEDEDKDEDEDDSEDESGSGSGSGSESDADSSDSDAPRVARQAPQVRTKYDRMFERKNQSILTDHYSKLVAQDDGADSDGDDVFTLARRDHNLDLSDGEEVDESVPIDALAKKLVTAEDLSKRKLKDATTRKGQLKSRGLPTKMLFNEEGEARDFYEHGKDIEQGAAAEEVRRAYVDEESRRMREADIVDREVAREKRREKKRKRKEREREMMAEQTDGSDDEEGGPVVYLGAPDEGGYGSDDAPSAVSRSPSPEPARPAKKQKAKATAIEDDEELALRLLRGE
jgi:ATP-dependent RNA helicase DDX10/DBP4